ncbi:hypothetical protein Q4561_01715 [Alteromonas sp. 1_MG-2023]|uniref:hypothetical protein n=1 Tax=Alteromonas sp. 1_MG-2023 TaxID=3062669 RepID=UPI0026E168C8|nr:hypothetical protein [Alteromonas sp. 1_MG-2023]MDO6565766.1 hypothetical protein [Alteromonas sp. 1_MG-2023]
MLRLFISTLVVGCSFSFLFSMGPFASCAQAQSLYEDITHAFLPEDITYVMAGEIRVPIFESSSALPVSRGVAIILADASPSGLSIRDARHLASLLNEKGWHAVVSPVSFALEEEPDLPVEEATHPKADSRLQQLNYVTASQHLTTLMNALNTHLESHQGFRMNIAYGMQAAQMLDLGSKGIIPSPDTLVTIAPFWPNVDINRSVPEFIAGTEFPVLDLSINDTNPWATQTEVKRKQLAATSLKLHYRQQSLATQNSTFGLMENENSANIQLIGANILGWAQYLGW